MLELQVGSLAFNVGARELNSGLCAYMTSYLSTEPSPQPIFHYGFHFLATASTHYAIVLFMTQTHICSPEKSYPFWLKKGH